MRRLAIAIVAVIVAVGGAAAAWLGLSYLTMPVSGLGVAYVMGARVALTSDQVQAIAKGETPKIQFLRKADDMSNKYLWQRAKISRPAACLYYEPDKVTGAIEHPKNCPAEDRKTMAGDQLHFAVEPGGALRIGVSDKPLTNTTHVTNGALYEAEGEIGIGKSIEQAAWFKVTLDAEWLNVFDPPRAANSGTDPDIMDGACESAIRLRLRDPIVLGVMPTIAARLCRVQPEKAGRPLLLVHFQSGPLQWMDWTNRLGCRALLYRLMPSRTPGDLAGCLGGPWARMDSTDLALAFFEVTPSGDFAAIR